MGNSSSSAPYLHLPNNIEHAGPYYGTSQAEYGYSFPIQLLIIIFTCIIGIVLPSIVAKFLYFNNNNNNRNSKSKRNKHGSSKSVKNKLDNDNDHIIQPPLKIRIINYLKDGLYIQLKSRPSINELMEEALLQEELYEFDKGLLTTRRDFDLNMNTNRVIGPGCLVKESDIRSYYIHHHHYDNDDDNDDDDDEQILYSHNGNGNGNGNGNNGNGNNGNGNNGNGANGNNGNGANGNDNNGNGNGNIEMVSTRRGYGATQTTATTTTTRTVPLSVYNADNTDDKVVFVLRLALGLLATGHCTVDVETTALKVAAALQLPTPRLSIGHRIFQASFGGGGGGGGDGCGQAQTTTNTNTQISSPSPTHLLTCKRDFIFSTLKELQLLADHIISGEILPCDCHIALRAMNNILDSPLPYGWLIYDLVFFGIGPWATIAAYYGSYYDMLGACFLSPITILTYRGCEYFNISHLEEILVPFNIGVFTPLIWRYIANGGQDLCHITPMYMGALLIHLPGAEIVWGVLEILQGSVVHGSSRLVKGLISAICLAVFVTLGWQVFGRNLAENWLLLNGVANDSGPTTNTTTTFKNKTIGAVTSLPDSKWCNNVVEDYYPDYFDWYFIIGVFNIPLNILCLMNVYIPVRDFLGPFIVGQVGLLTLGYLQFQCTSETCELAGPLQNLISAYVATWIAMLVEVVSGLPSPISVIPVLFIFAPGSSAVLAIIGAMHEDLGDTVGTNKASWDDLTMQAFSYGVGIYLAQETWKPFLKGKFKSRRRTAFINDRKLLRNNNNNNNDDDINDDGANGGGDDDNNNNNIVNFDHHNNYDKMSGVVDVSLIDLNLDQNFHAPQTAVHGNGYRNRVKNSSRLLADEINFGLSGRSGRGDGFGSTNDNNNNNNIRRTSFSSNSSSIRSSHNNNARSSHRVLSPHINLEDINEN